jgi:uridylate kinase
MKTTKPIAYQRILLKLSGEALMGQSQMGIDPKILDNLAKDIAQLRELGVQVGLVVGGGNLFRGAALSEVGLDRVTGDYMGMLATMMNGLALRDALERAEVPTNIMSALPLIGVIDAFDRRKAIHHLKNNRVVIFTGGTGNPFFTTDSAASLRAIEVDANVLLKATKVDGIYSADPLKDRTATRYDSLSYTEVIEKNLAVMDATAICMCRDHRMPIRVFDMSKPGVLERIVRGENEGTLVY